MNQVRALAIFVAAPVLAAVGGATPTADAGSGTPIAGGTAAQRTLLRRVLHSMGGTQIRGVRIARAGPGSVRLAMQPARFERSRAGTSVRVEWDGHFVAYELLRLSLRRRMPAVVGFSILGQRHTFRTLKPRAVPRFDRRRIVPPVGRALRRSGARTIEYNLFRPSGAAFAVVVTARRPARFIRHRLAPTIRALNAVVARLDGFYVAVTDARRHVVFAYGRVDLRGQTSSSLYVREDLLGCAETLPVLNEVAPDGATPCPVA